MAGQFIPQQGTIMPLTATADLDVAASAAARLIDMEMRCCGVPYIMARERIAKREGISPGTVENILKRRAKSVAGWVRDRLCAALMRGLQTEISRLEHELQMARQIGVRHSAVEMAAAEAAILKAKEALRLP